MCFRFRRTVTTRSPAPSTDVLWRLRLARSRSFRRHRVTPRIARNPVPPSASRSIVIHSKFLEYVRVEPWGEDLNLHFKCVSNGWSGFLKVGYRRFFFPFVFECVWDFYDGRCKAISLL